MSSEEYVVDVLITTAQSDCNRYEYDAQAQAVRLAEVLRQPDWLPVDLGIVPDSLAGGGPVAVLLVTHRPVFPGCLVAARVIGAIALDVDAPLALVAVPTADEAQGSVVHYEQLPLGLRRQVEGLRLAEVEGARVARWLRADEVARPLHEARQAFRLARAQQGERAGSSAPAWATTLGRGQRRELGVETDVHSEAEYSLYMLPYRFQRYVAEFLLPDERILLLASRHPVSYGGWGLWGRQHAREGALMLTDRQVVLMEDIAPPDGTLVPWGYEVSGVALERLVSVALRELRGHARLELTAVAAGGMEHLAWPLSEADIAGWRQAAAMLKAFLPMSDDKRLLRLPSPVAVPGPGEFFADRAEEAKAGRLRALLAREAEHDGELLASAFTVGYEDRREGAKALAVTPRRLLVVSERAPESIASYPMVEIGSAALRHSLLRSELRLARPGKASVALPFDFVASRAFLAVFAALRRLQGTPAHGEPISMPRAKCEVAA